MKAHSEGMHMFKPLTLTLAELAARWGLTPRQVLQHAQQPGVPLYFAYEGLVFDIGDQWHRHGGDWRETERRDSLVEGVKNKEAWLQRRNLGKLTEWDQLTQEEAIKLRAEIDVSKLELRSLNDVLEQRNAERHRCHFRGFLRAAPATLWDIESLGATPFPLKAFHPSSPINVVRLPDAPSGQGGLIWDGRLVSLEPMSENDRHWKARLTADDLVAITSEVKAIEAMMKAKEGAVNPAPSAPARNAEKETEKDTKGADLRPAAPGGTMDSKPRARKKPGGGDALTPIVWETCYDLHDAGEKVTPGSVMRELKIRAQSLDPKARGPLMGTSAGGVKFETIDGEEKEMNSAALAARINAWKDAQS